MAAEKEQDAAAEQKGRRQSIAALTKTINIIAAVISEEILGFGAQNETLGDLTSAIAHSMLARSDESGQNDPFKRAGQIVDQALWDLFWDGLSDKALKKMAESSEHVAHLLCFEAQTRGARKEAEACKASSARPIRWSKGRAKPAGQKTAPQRCGFECGSLRMADASGDL